MKKRSGQNKLTYLRRVWLLFGILLVALVVFGLVRYFLLARGEETGLVALERVLWETIPTLIVLLAAWIGTIVFYCVCVKKPAETIEEQIGGAIERRRTGESAQVTEVGEWAGIVRAIGKMNGALDEYVAQSERTAAEQSHAETLLSAALAIEQDVSPSRRGFRASHYGIAAAVIRSDRANGDFYDFFFTGNHAVCFVVGDVWGSGFAAVRFSARVKELFRMSVQNSETLLDAVGSVNAALLQNNEEQLALTAFFGLFLPATGELRYVNAGHFPPALVGDESRFLRMNVGAPVGLYDDAAFLEEYLILKPGNAMLLYTDGVPYAGNERGERFGYDRLFQAIETGWKRSLGAEEVVSSLENALTEFCGRAKSDDDGAFLALYYPSGLQKQFAPKTSELERLRDLLLDWLKDDVRKNKIYLACEEAFTNIVNYSGASTIQLDCQIEGDNLIVRFVDDGVPFNPLQPQGERDYASGGMGMAIIRQIAGEVHYRMQENRNVLTMRFPVLKRD